MNKKSFWSIVFSILAATIVLSIIVAANNGGKRVVTTTDVERDNTAVTRNDALQEIADFSSVDLSQADVDYSGGETNYYFENSIAESIINHDAIILGKNVDINNEYNSGITLGAGLNVKVDARMDTAILAGQTVDVNKQVDKDLAVAAQIVNIDKASIIGRDVALAGQTVNVSGTIYGNVVIAGSIVNFENARILGNVYVAAGEINVKDDAKIYGELTYNSDKSITVPDTAVAKITHTKTTVTQENMAVGIMAQVVIVLIGFLGAAFATRFVSYLAPKTMEKCANDKSFGGNFGYGILSFIIIPIIAIALMLVPGLEIVSAIILSLYGLIGVAAIAPATTMFGRFVRGFIGKNKPDDYADTFIGSVFVGLSVLFPIFLAIVEIAGVGFTIRSIKEDAKAKHAKKAA